MFNKAISSFLILLFMGSTDIFAQINQDEELGQVRWNRNYDEALTISKKENKDVLMLFQEVPGCATCRNYGHNVLSHPLMVEAIESLFVPLAIFNNKGGRDRDILTLYNEPSWNNPVVRIIDHKGQNLTQRISNDYSALTLCKRMKETLEKRNKPIPEYLNLLEMELSAVASGSVSEKYYKMYCFWSGEKQLGKVDGVLDTESGFYKYSEVVKVKYDEDLVDENELDQYAKSNNYQPIEVNESAYRVAPNDVHYYLQRSNYKYLPLTEIQKTRINSALGSNQSGELYLSPKQKLWFDQLNQNSIRKEDLMNREFSDAWDMIASLN